MIKFENVNKTYDNGVQALKDINIEIEQGEFVSIIGLSGAGKSTLLRTINKMHDISSGTLTVNDVDVSTLKGKELRNFRHGVGMVFQSFNLIDRTSALNNVLVSKVANMNLMAVLLKKNKKEDKIDALESLQTIGLLDKAYVRVDQLSGGQKQRVALARTLAQHPKIILADEPVASLDPITAEDVMEDFKKINQERNITIVANMHHVDTAIKYSDRIIGIKEGTVIYNGPAKEITNEILEKVYGRALSDDDIRGR